MTSPFFSIFAAGRNANVFATRCIESVLSQDCDDYELIYVDDASDDGTFGRLAQFQSHDRIRLVSNTTRQHKLANLLRELPSFSGEVYIDLGGDDRFCIPSALSRIRAAYDSDDVDMTVGGCFVQGDIRCPDPVTFERLHAQDFPTPNTARLSLIRKIISEHPDGMIDVSTGAPYRTCADSAIFVPVIALARKIVPISDLLIEMCRTNGNSHDHAEFPGEQIATGNRILNYWRKALPFWAAAIPECVP